MTSKISGILFFSLIILLMQSCYSGNRSQDSDSNRSQIHTPGKPGASVSISNSQPIVLGSLGAQDLVLTLEGPAAFDELSVRVASSDGLSLLSPIDSVTFLPTSTGKYNLPLSLNVKREGRHYVRLYVELVTANSRAQRVVSAIIQVGSTITKQQKTIPKRNTDGVISLPAQEQVMPKN
jgi:hypothetical protein